MSLGQPDRGGRLTPLPLAGGAETLQNDRIFVTDSSERGAFELSPERMKEWEISLSPEYVGRERGRISIYRMTVSGDVVSLLRSTSVRMAVAAFSVCLETGGQ